MDDIAEKLSQMIEDRDFGNDGRLPPERELANTMGVTRNRLRKALLEMEAEGLIWRKVGKGTFARTASMVTPEFLPDFASRTNPVEIMEVMQMVQPKIAAMAAMKATNHEISKMADYSRRCSQAQDINSRLKWDAALHDAIARSTHNNIVIFISELLYSSKSVWGPRKKAVFTPKRWLTYTAQHDELIKAINERDPEKAYQIMADHMETVRRHLLGPN